MGVGVGVEPGLGWQGQLELDFEHQAGKTILSREFMKSPMKVQRPFYPEPAVCHVVTLHTAGGIVGGDRLSSHIRLHPNAQALLTTAAAGKIYRSNGNQSVQSIHTQVAAGGCLEWLPQESIVFAGAKFQQDHRVELATDALWLGWEVVRFGRTARGERFETGDWRSRTQVWREGQLLWLDPQFLQGGTAMLDSPHGLGGCPVVGSFAVVGRAVPAGLLQEARQSWGDRPKPDARATAGVSQLMAGMICRYRGHSSHEARRWFTQVWHAVRATLLHREPCLPRVW